MAILGDLPPELLIELMERMPDFCSLHALVHALPAARRAYQEFAYSILQSILQRQNNTVQDLVASAVEAYLADDQLYCTVREVATDWAVPDIGRIFRPWPGEEKAARQKVKEDAFRMLKTLAMLEDESRQLTEWCWINQLGDSNKISKDDLLFVPQSILTESYWQLRRLVDRARKYNHHTSLDQRLGVMGGIQGPRRVHVQEMITNWMFGLPDRNIIAIAHMLDLLKPEYECAARHGFFPSEDALTLQIFGRHGVVEPAFRNFPERVNAELSRRGFAPQPRFATPQEAVRLIQAMARPLSKCTKPTPAEMAEFRQRLEDEKGGSSESTEEVRERVWSTYVERFKPLLGMPFGITGQLDSDYHMMKAVLKHARSSGPSGAS